MNVVYKVIYRLSLYTMQSQDPETNPIERKLIQEKRFLKIEHIGKTK